MDQRAFDIAQKIVDENSPQAYRVIKAMIKQWSNVAMVNREVAREMTAAVWESEEFSERADAFFSKEELQPRAFSGTLGKVDED